MLQNEIWDKMFLQTDGKYPSEELIRFVARNFYNKKNRSAVKILEVGCGTGGNIWYLSNEGFDTYGIDGSAVGIKKAEVRMAKEKLKANLCLGDIVSLPYIDNFFDAVIDSECLYSNDTNNLVKIFIEIKRVLKPKGLFYSRTFSTDTFKGNPISMNEYEFKGAQDGPFANAGFFRLIDKRLIHELYGNYFELVSIDKSNYTHNNSQFNVSEWHIISRKA